MPKSEKARPGHVLEAIEHIRALTQGKELPDIQDDRDRRLLIERNFEIISEASRHLPEDLKQRHSSMPWRQIAGIGNILRHDCDEIALPLLFRTSVHDLPILKAVCREELARDPD